MKKRAAVFLSVLVAIGFFSFIQSPIRVYAATGLKVDGSATGWCGHNTNSCTANLTTVLGNDVIVVYTSEALDLQTSCTFSVSDTSNLSWQARSAIVFSPDARDQIQEFWAVSPGPLVSDIVTESILGCASGIYGGEYNGVMAFGINGANLSSPWDPNSGVPGTAGGESSGASVQVSTSNANDIIIAGSWHGIATPTPGPGFSIVTSNAGGPMAVESSVVNGTLPNSTVSFPDSQVAPWVMIGDAVEASTGTSSNPGFSIGTNNRITVTVGNDANELVIVSGNGNFTGTVSLTSAVIPATPNAPTLRLNSTQVTVPMGSFGFTYLAVITNPNTTSGGYNFTISGSAMFNGKTLQQTFFGNVIVQAPPQPDFFINAYPTFFTVFAGSSATSSINLYPAQPITNSFTVTLSVQLPHVIGFTGSVNPSSVILSAFNQSIGFATLTVNTLSTTPAGNYTFTVTGRSGTNSHILTFSLQVKPPPILTLTPTSGPIGTTIVARGSGFIAQYPQYGPTEILVTFDDQLIGFTFTSTGSFNFTFNVPLAQPGAHTVKATETIFIGSSTLLTATAPFQVTSPAALSTSLTVGSIYFPVDRAVAMIQVTSGGVPVSSSSLQLTVTLTRPDNTKVVLNITSLGSGLFRSTYVLPKTAQIGTYSIQAVAHLSGATDGSALGSFEVKLPWLSSQASGAITAGGIASIGAIGAALVSWRKGYFRKPSKNSPWT